MAEFRPLSKDIEKQLSKAQRKSDGVFFTPRQIRERLLTRQDVFEGIRVLEPSAGSCEFVQDVLALEPSARVTAIEKNPVVASSAKAVFEPLIQGDFLTYDAPPTFDLIIGNPPYLQIKDEKNKWRAEFGAMLGGKFDLYILFLLKALRLLRPRGVLKFILPTSFLSTFSYNEVRELLVARYTIKDVFVVKDCDSWNDTKQNVTGLTIVNCPPVGASPFCAVFSPFYFINDAEIIQRLTTLTRDTIPLRDTGVDIKTGEIVWGAKYVAVTTARDPILIRNSFLAPRGGLIIPKVPKQQLRVVAPEKYLITEPVILVNRGNGNNGKLNVRFVYFDPNDASDVYVAENHVYKIYGDARLLNRVYQLLLRPEIAEFIELSNGSGFLTKKYIEILPIPI